SMLSLLKLPPAGGNLRRKCPFLYPSALKNPRKVTSACATSSIFGSLCKQGVFRNWDRIRSQFAAFRRVEEGIRGPDGCRVARPPAIIVALERVQPDASLPHEPGGEALDFAGLLGGGERVRDERVLQGVDAAMPDTAILETPRPDAPEGR